LEQLPQEDADYVYNMGCLLYQEGNYEEASKKFMSAMQVLGHVPGNQSNSQFSRTGFTPVSADVVGLSCFDSVRTNKYHTNTSHSLLLTRMKSVAVCQGP